MFHAEDFINQNAIRRMHAKITYYTNSCKEIIKTLVWAEMDEQYVGKYMLRHMVCWAGGRLATEHDTYMENG